MKILILAMVLMINCSWAQDDLNREVSDQEVQESINMEYPDNGQDGSESDQGSHQEDHQQEDNYQEDSGSSYQDESGDV